MKYLCALLCLSLISCNDNYVGEPIPYALVDTEINLNKIEYLDLQQDGGYAYLNNEGVRGIVIYRKSAQVYYAFERNCSFQPNDACATVDVDPSGLFMIDTCCGSIFDLEGHPSNGPARNSLRKYYTRLNGNYLSIRNDP